jgi:hypothetical protein
LHVSTLSTFTIRRHAPEGLVAKEWDFKGVRRQFVSGMTKRRQADPPTIVGKPFLKPIAVVPAPPWMQMADTLPSANIQSCGTLSEAMS